VVAFLAGSIATGVMVYADKNDDSNGNPFKKIADLLEQILDAIEEQGDSTPQGTISITTKDGTFTCQDGRTITVVGFASNYNVGGRGSLFLDANADGTTGISIQSIVSDGNTFELSGVEPNFQNLCNYNALITDLPWQYTLTGDCTKDLGPMTFESDIGISGEFPANVVCIVG